MDNAELREACKLAGLRIIKWKTSTETRETVRIEDGKQPLTLTLSSPLLVPYLASLLLAKIKFLDSFDVEVNQDAKAQPVWLADLFTPFRSVAGVSHISSLDEGPFVAIIRAAMAALKEQDK